MKTGELILAFCLTALAGYVDAIGFLALGGNFVSFMSGNSTQMSVSLAEESHAAIIPASLIASFMAGVIIGSFLGHLAGTRRRAAVLGFVFVMLVLASALGKGHGAFWAGLAMACGMGAENAVFEQGGKVQLGLTYFTGALTNASHKIAHAFLKGDKFAWARDLFLWGSFVGGALLGGTIFRHLGLDGLWFAAAAAAILACVA
jgi:uncharacterized membrane protein YoaK (UPF0700 family)